MSLFHKIDRLDTYALFATVLRRSRLSMATAYDASFEAYLHSVELQEQHRFGMAALNSAWGLSVFASDTVSPSLTRAELDQIWLDAIAEDFQADQQAAPVILFADDSLQRFAKGVLETKKAPGLEPGYGPTYGGHGGPPVHLTTLLRAATNTLRHVSEWDDNLNLQRLPYPDPASLKKGSAEWQAMQSITVLQRAFGVGNHELIRDVVSHRTLAAVDGQIPNFAYARFEAAMVETARDIARQGPSDATARLEEALKRDPSVAPR